MFEEPVRINVQMFTICVYHLPVVDPISFDLITLTACGGRGLRDAAWVGQIHDC